MRDRSGTGRRIGHVVFGLAGRGASTESEVVHGAIDDRIGLEKLRCPFGQSCAVRPTVTPAALSCWNAHR